LKLFTAPGTSDDDYNPPALAIAPSIEEWKRRFNILTYGLLEGMDWSNVLCAGGSILGVYS
jgi:hypothetical protein